METELACQVCCVSLDALTVGERQVHYEAHFGQQPESGHSTSVPIDLSVDDDRGPMTEKNHEGQQHEGIEFKVVHPEKQNTFWYNSKGDQPPSNFTPCLIPLLRQALLKSHEKGNTVRASLCHPSSVHVGTEYWDAGWGCGYRNFLMACTALMGQNIEPSYEAALQSPRPPGVRHLQHWIEDSWKAGYDIEGANDLKHKLVGTRKWIGTAELHVAFLTRGVPSRLVEFPDVTSDAAKVLKWVEDYFTSEGHEGRHFRGQIQKTVDEALRGASPVVVTNRMPIVLQHQGHSRTIVGYERRKDGTVNLLCFDPSRRQVKEVRNAALSRYHTLSGGPPSSPSALKKRSLSPSKILNKIFHPRGRERDGSPDEGRKRRASGSIERDDEPKRVRGGLLGSNKEGPIEVLDSDDEVQIVESTGSREAVRPADELGDGDMMKMLEHFRLKPARVGKKNKYQILYFPLTALLTPQERWAGRVVTSDVIE